MWLSEPSDLLLTHDLREAPKIPKLQAGEMHLFCFPAPAFENPALEIAYLGALSTAEKDRAAGIKSPENRRSFIQSRARLRWLLGHQLGVPAKAVPIALGPYGKPYHQNHEMDFNLSHTRGVILIGMARGMALGVDVEQPSARRRLDGLIPEVFSSAEQREFEGLTEAEQHERFLRGWTLKEAFVKATGRGIAMGLSKVEIRADFEGFMAIPEGQPLDYRVFESRCFNAQIALVHAGESRSLRYYRGVFES